MQAEHASLTKIPFTTTLESTGASRRPAVNRTAGGFLFRIRRLPALTLPLLIGACMVSPPKSQVGGPTARVRLLPSAPTAQDRAPTTPSPSPSLPAPQRLSPKATPCTQLSGRIVHDEVRSPELSRSLPIRIYLPPCYTPMLLAGYPTLYLLHGLATDDAQWDDLGVGEAADRLISSGQIAPFLMIMPWARPGLDLEEALVEVLVPYVESAYSGNLEASRRAIGGISRGGGWAFRIGFRHPATFKAVGLHSPAVPEVDRTYFYFWTKDLPASELPRVWIDIGDHDTLLASTEALVAMLEEQGVVFTLKLQAGDHAPDYWKENVEMYLRWYAEGWKTKVEGERGPTHN